MKIRLMIALPGALFFHPAMAQTSENPFYSNGKIYVVVAIMSIIFLGLFVFLMMIDRRLKKTEKELKNQEPEP